MTCREKKTGTGGATSFAEMRKDFRAKLSSTAYISLGGQGERAGSWIKAEVLDLSLGGARLRFELDDKSLEDLPGTACTFKFFLNGKDRVLPGRFAVVYEDSSKEKKEIANNCPEIGIAFEGLSVEGKSDLVSLFMWSKLEQGQVIHQDTGEF